jgi:hypothetical protein
MALNEKTIRGGHKAGKHLLEFLFFQNLYKAGPVYHLAKAIVQILPITAISLKSYSVPGK